MAIVAICRGTRSGGKAMAECLADHLGYPILGREVIQTAAEDLGVSARLLEEKMADRPTMWGRFSSMRRVYIAAVKAALARRAVEGGGNLVYHGLAGGVLLRGAPCALCLRLVAPLPRRIEIVMRESNVDRALAEAYIREIDESRARWFRVMYDADILDPALYDMVINLEEITVEGACALTRAALQAPEFAPTEGGLARLADFRLACEVEVAFAADSDLRSLDLTVTAEGGGVTVRGQAPLTRSGRTGNRISERARSVAGVERVRLEVSWFDPYP